MSLRNINILSHHYAVLQPRRHIYTLCINFRYIMRVSAENFIIFSVVYFHIPHGTEVVMPYGCFNCKNYGAKTFGIVDNDILTCSDSK